MKTIMETLEEILKLTKEIEEHSKEIQQITFDFPGYLKNKSNEE